MKVMIVTSYWINSPGGGVKTYLSNFVNEMENRGINVEVIFREGIDDTNHHISGPKFFYSLRAFFILTKIKPDIVNTQGTWYTLLPSVIYKKLSDIYLIHTFRTEPDRKLSYISTNILQFLLNNCDCVSFVSKGLENVTREHYGFNFNKTVIMYPGVNPKNVSNEEISNFYDKYNLSHDSIILLLQGFTANKLKVTGAKMTIDAVNYLRVKYPNIVLIITRDGKYLEELQNYAKSKNLMDHVIFTGDIENPFIPLKICNIFMFPWLGKSGVSNALLEAMSVGVPILATSENREGVAEVIENEINGILTKPDIDSIVNFVDYLIQNPKFAQTLGENAKKTVEDNYSWEKTVDTFISTCSKS